MNNGAARTGRVPRPRSLSKEPPGRAARGCEPQPRRARLPALSPALPPRSPPPPPAARALLLAALRARLRRAAKRFAARPAGSRPQPDASLGSRRSFRCLRGRSGRLGRGLVEGTPRGGASRLAWLLRQVCACLGPCWGTATDLSATFYFPVLFVVSHPLQSQDDFPRSGRGALLTAVRKTTERSQGCNLSSYKFCT